MKILLVAPSSGKWRDAARTRLFNGRTFRFSLLSLLSVAAATPPGHDISIADEQVEDIPFGADADLVGITCMTALAPRAYEIAAALRARGIPVALGGMHPTLCPEEALAHADAVVVGEAENIWPRVVTDAAAGRLGGLYRAPAPPDLAGLAAPPRHLLRPGRYAMLHAIQATRGCPHHCAFCAVSAFSGASQRRRPVGDVAREAADLPGRRMLFVDDNLTADPDYALDLCRALEPLNKRWMTQSTLAVADNPDLVAALARAGCIGLFVGLETFSTDNLASVGKSFHSVAHYRSAIETLHRHGIGVEAGIVFGFDHDDPGVFARTLAVLDELRVDMIQASILTPLPGTPAFGKMRDRITDTDWSHYDFHTAVFRPARMTAEQLQAGHD
jgi:radical SAM superfamily enzyme YgiQ (UPF0313 family)